MILCISFSTAALVFGIVLFVLILVLGHGQEHNNLQFRSVVLTVLIGDIVSILDIVLRRYLFTIYPNVPKSISLGLLILVFVTNILLTYFISRYFDSFFSEGVINPRFRRINQIILIFGLCCCAFVYFRELPDITGTSLSMDVTFMERLIIAYLIEIYYLIYSLAVMVRYRNNLSRRAYYTAIGAFTVTVGGIIAELLNPTGILFNYFGAVIGLYIFYIGVEIPDYKNLLKSMEDLSLEKERADRANNAKSDFLASMSHEIRTPINTIIGMNEMILHRSGESEILDYAANIDNAGHLLLNLVNGILDFSKIEQGKMELVPVEYDLKDLLRRVKTSIQKRAEDKGLSLVMKVDSGLPARLFGDDMRFGQIIINLLTNAVKYTDTGSVTLAIRQMRREDGSCAMEISVSDTGIGIKKEDILNLYSGFFHNFPFNGLFKSLPDFCKTRNKSIVCISRPIPGNQ